MLVVSLTGATEGAAWSSSCGSLRLMGSFALASAFGGEYKQDYLQPGSESKAAADTLSGPLPQQAGGHRPDRGPRRDGVASGEAKARAERILADVAENEHVVGVVSPYSDEGAAQISADGTTAYADVALDRTVNEFTPEEARELVEPVLAAGDDALQVEVGGPVAALSQTAPFGSEGIGLIAAAVILLFTFGSAVAMGLPLVTALFGLGSAVALGEAPAPGGRRPGLGPATAAMVGLGVGIDYALLIVTRFRSSLAEDRSRDGDADARSRPPDGPWSSPASPSSSPCSASCWWARRPSTASPSRCRWPCSSPWSPR